MVPAKTALRAIAVAAVFASVLAAVAYAVGLATLRPILYGEAEVLYEATRIHAHLPLYTDALAPAGVMTYGAPPSRVFVTYPPVWSWLISPLEALPKATLPRLFNTALWFGLLAWIARAPRRESAKPRFAPMFAAAYVAGIYVLILWASSGRPDTPAVALAAIALMRTVRAKKLGPLEAALFALAFWMKPNVAGMAIGAFVVQMSTAPRVFARSLASALGVSLALMCILYLASGGMFLAHLNASLGQPLSLALWIEQLRSRTAFAIPLAITAGYAWRVRRDPAGKYASAAFAGSLVTALLALAKLGSASNYWLETAVASVILYTCSLPTTEEAAERETAAAAFVALAAVWQCVATLGSVNEAFADEPRRSAFVNAIALECIRDPSDVVLADDPGLELALDGRVIAPAFQMAALVRSGRFPGELWARDMTDPHVRCLVTHGDLETDEPAGSIHERYPPSLRRKLLQHFARVRDEEGLVLYRAH